MFIFIKLENQYNLFLCIDVLCLTTPIFSTFLMSLVNMSLNSTQQLLDIHAALAGYHTSCTMKLMKQISGHNALRSATTFLPH